MNKDIIRIAEAMGYQPTSDGGWDGGIRKRRKDGTWHGPITHISKGFDFLTSHDDCHALIEWLNGRGYDVEIWWSGNATRAVNVRCRVKIRFRDGTWRDERACDDYRIGVVELTLKILDESDE